MDYIKKIITDIEIHSVDGIIECFKNGVDPNSVFHGEPLINELTSEYGRTDRFKKCVKAFVDHGLKFNNKELLAVLLDDAISLEQHIIDDKKIVSKTYSLRCAFTPLQETTLLHICAEFNHLSCAKVLVKYGADVNARAGLDKYGFGGQTPVFHTVNQIGNNSFDMLKYLLSLKVDLHITVKGLIWGKGYDWETFIPAINPLSYALMGLLPQMHRTEQATAQIVSLLLKEAYGIDYTLPNIPNRYLHQ